MIQIEHKCRDYGDRPGCLGDPDERFTMRFDDIGEDPIYWCSFCGPEAHELDKLFQDTIKKAIAKGPEAVKRVFDLMEEVEKEQHDNKVAN